MVTHKFRLIKDNAWGIAIDVVGEVKEANLINDSLIHVADNIYIQAINGFGNSCQASEKEMILAGLRWAYSLMEKEEMEKTWVLSFSFHIIYTDYMEQGLFFAVAEWLLLALNQAMPTYEVYVKRGRNAYYFPLIEEPMERNWATYKSYEVYFDKEMQKHIFTNKTKT